MGNVRVTCSTTMMFEILFGDEISMAAGMWCLMAESVKVHDGGQQVM
jgi:hypothetical protein